MICVSEEVGQHRKCVWVEHLICIWTFNALMHQFLRWKSGFWFWFYTHISVIILFTFGWACAKTFLEHKLSNNTRNIFRMSFSSKQCSLSQICQFRKTLARIKCWPAFNNTPFIRVFFCYQCSDLSLSLDGVEQRKIGFKGILTLPKPIQFKSSIKKYSQVMLNHCLKSSEMQVIFGFGLYSSWSNFYVFGENVYEDHFVWEKPFAGWLTFTVYLLQDVSFMETFVFTLRLQQLHCSALVLRLQAHSPRKRTVADCVLSLRQLGPQETEHWLELNPPSKSSVSVQHTCCQSGLWHQSPGLVHSQFEKTFWKNNVVKLSYLSWL